MPPKTTTTREMVLEAAFELLKDEGLSNLSSRNIAKRLNCSITPIFSSFKNMSELEEEVMRMAWELLITYTERDYTDNIFLNQGIGIVLFARDHKLLYREMFLYAASFEAMVGDSNARFEGRSKLDPNLASLPEEAVNDIRMKMWLFSHGLCALVNSDQGGDYSIEYITKMLYETGRAVIVDLRTFAGQEDDGFPEIKEEFKEKGKVIK